MKLLPALSALSILFAAPAIAHPLMEWNHNVIMERGQGLSAHLKAELIGIASPDHNRFVVSAVSS